MKNARRNRRNMQKIFPLLAKFVRMRFIVKIQSLRIRKNSLYLQNECVFEGRKHCDSYCKYVFSIKEP